MFVEAGLSLKALKKKTENFVFVSEAGHTLDGVKPHSEPDLSSTTIGGGRGLICIL